MVDDLLLVDEDKSVAWNYVTRVDKELEQSNDSDSVLLNPLIPSSYKQVIGVLSRSCNFSRTALLMDDSESFVAFMLVVDEECIPFMLDELDDIVMPMRSVYKVFFDTTVATSVLGNGVLEEFIANVVLPDLNDNFDSWVEFKCDEL